MDRKTLFNLALLGIAMATPTFGQGTCPSGVVGYWPLDGDATEAVHGLPGSLVGTADFGPAIVGAGLELAGDASYLDAGTHPELSTFGGTEMTIAAWIRREPDGPAGDPDAAVLTNRTLCGFPPPPATPGLGNFSFYGGLGESLMLSKWGPEAIPGDPFSKPETTFFTFASAPIGQWTHVAAAYDGTTTRFYIDGMLVQEAAASGPAIAEIASDLHNMQIGWDSCGSYWTGGIDELSIWSIALTDAEVDGLFEDGLSGVSLCDDDSDGDGVPDEADVCPDTTGEALVDGCDCSQILEFKSGKSSSGKCSPGTLNVFEQRRGWARHVPVP